MTSLLNELLNRLTKEIKITLAGSQEAVLAVSERVNRKTQALRFHWRAATLRHQMEAEYQQLGHTLCSGFSTDAAAGPIMTNTVEIDTRFIESVTAVQLLKKELQETESVIRDMETEVLHEDLLAIQRDLLNRAAGMSRVMVTPASSVLGKPIGQLHLPPLTRVVCVLRGPVLLAQIEEAPIRSGDILILLGPKPEVQFVAQALRG